MARPEILLLVVGLGNVSRRLLQMLDDAGDQLPFTWRLAGVGSRSRGFLVDSAGLDHRACLAASERGDAWPGARAGDGVALLGAALPALTSAAADGRVVVVETTVLDAERGEPATTHVRLALAAGAHVVTANKGPTAFAYHELAAQAARVGRRFLFESAVMDGVPVFALAGETLPAIRITGFRGVVNTTCGYILAAMERGVPFADALADMQARGIAEADPSLDIDGWDAAAKAAALANVLLDARTTPHHVMRAGIREVDAAQLARGSAQGRRLRLVSRAHRDGDGIQVSATPEWLEAGDPLAQVSGLENAVYLTTDHLGEIGIVQRDGGLTQTAYGLLADLVRVSRRRAG